MGAAHHCLTHACAARAQGGGVAQYVDDDLKVMHEAARVAPQQTGCDGHPQMPRARALPACPRLYRAVH
jgi:hypothetical protein